MTRRTPSAILEAKGAFAKNPNRKREDFQAGEFNKEPPAYFHAGQIDVWNEIASLLPDGVLQATDRLTVELASRQIDAFRGMSDADVTMAQVAQIRTTLAKLGMTPADRSMVTAIKKPSGVNPFLALIGGK